MPGASAAAGETGGEGNPPGRRSTRSGSEKRPRSARTINLGTCRREKVSNQAQQLSRSWKAAWTRGSATQLLIGSPGEPLKSQCSEVPLTDHLGSSEGRTDTQVLGALPAVRLSAACVGDACRHDKFSQRGKLGRAAWHPLGGTGRSLGQTCSSLRGRGRSAFRDSGLRPAGPLAVSGS